MPSGRLFRSSACGQGIERMIRVREIDPALLFNFVEIGRLRPCGSPGERDQSGDERAYECDPPEPKRCDGICLDDLGL